MRVEEKKDVSCFIIEGAEREDEGNYTIVVTNPAGEDKAVLFVKIVGEWGFCMCQRQCLHFNHLFFIFKHFLDVPDPPEHVKCISVGEDTATIVWDAPKFDGGAPLKGKTHPIYCMCLLIS